MEAWQSGEDVLTVTVFQPSAPHGGGDAELVGKRDGKLVGRERMSGDRGERLAGGGFLAAAVEEAGAI